MPAGVLLPDEVLLDEALPPINAASICICDWDWARLAFSALSCFVKFATFWLINWFNWVM